jgi:hypothetical protein
MTQKNTEAAGVPTTTVGYNAGDFIEKMPGYRASHCLGVASSLIGHRCSRSDIFRAPLAPRRLLRECLDRRGSGGKSKDIEVPTQVVRAGFAGGFQGIPNDHRINKVT